MIHKNFQHIKNIYIYTEKQNIATKHKGNSSITANIYSIKQTEQQKKSENKQ